MPTAKLRPGVGALISIQKNRIFPKRLVSDKYGQVDKNDRLDGCILLREGTKRTTSLVRPVYFFRHEDFGDAKLFACKRFCKVTQEGGEAGLFNEVTSDALVVRETQVENPPLTNDINDDIARFLSLGLVVDDDNLPAPENVPTNDDTRNSDVEYYDWNSAVGCNKLKLGGLTDYKPYLSDEPRGTCFVEWIKFWLPWDFIVNVVIPETNRRIDGTFLTEGEFMKYLGLWFLMSTVNSGVDKRSFWSSQPTNPFFGAPFRLNEFMSYNRFQQIGSALKYTDIQPPTFVDKCHEIRQMLEAFNDLMERIFKPGWVVCLDESMSPWTNQFTCPAFVFCPRKPHPKGNEYHTIADGLSGILFRLEMVEGKDEPGELAGKKKIQKFWEDSWIVVTTL